MIDWKRTQDELPVADGQRCLLYSAALGMVVGPIAWSTATGSWLDLFGPLATKEAGTMYSPATEGLTHWAAFNEPAA